MLPGRLSMTAADTKAFWEWFCANDRFIIEKVEQFDHDWLRKELTWRVEWIHPKINWEIGPGKARPWQFVLSSVVTENLEHTETAIRAAPDLDDWEWHAWKPAKPGNHYQLELTDAEGEQVHIDAKDWQYVLKKNRSGKPFSILFLSSEPLAISEANRFRAVQLLLENIVGEKVLLETFERVDLLPADRMPATVPRSEIRFLADQPRQ
jgi:hypothetical protein